MQPNDAKSHTALGNVLKAQGDARRAAAYLGRAKELQAREA
jgi:hypothetical protein